MPTRGTDGIALKTQKLHFVPLFLQHRQTQVDKLATFLSTPTVGSNLMTEKQTEDVIDICSQFCPTPSWDLNVTRPHGQTVYLNSVSRCCMDHFFNEEWHFIKRPFSAKTLSEGHTDALSVIMTFFSCHIGPLRPFNVKKKPNWIFKWRWLHLNWRNETFILRSQPLSCFLSLSEVHPRTPPPWFCLITGDGAALGGQQLREDEWNGIKLKIRIIKSWLNASEVDSRWHLFPPEEGWAALIGVLEQQHLINIRSCWSPSSTLLHSFFSSKLQPFPLILA